MRRGSLVVVFCGFLAGLLLSLLLGRLGGRLSRVHDGSSSGAAGAQAPYDRIVSLAANVTETVYALGCDDRLVGISEFCTVPPAAQEKVRVGGVINPNLEVMASLEPDLVLAQMPNEDVDRWCRDRGIVFRAVEMTDLAAVESGIREIGTLLGVPGRAGRLWQEMEERLDTLRKKTSNRPRPRVLLVISRSPDGLTGIYTAGRDTFLDELLGVAGGENLFGDSSRAYPLASKEVIQARRPDIVVELRPGETVDAERRQRLLADWRRLPSLPAVRKGRVYIVTDPFVQVPGPRVAETAAVLARLCHPEAVPDPPGESDPAAEKAAADDRVTGERR